MAVRRSYTPTLGYSKEYNYHLQRAPSLSFQQYARSVTPLPGVPKWQTTGIYEPPIFHSYLSPKLRKSSAVSPVQPWIYSYRRQYSIPTYTLKQYNDKKPRPPEPIWHPIGPCKHKEPTPLNPARKLARPVHEPVWHPVGEIHHTPVSYFDPPNLRWSLQELMRSMPDLRTRWTHSSTKQF